MHYYKILKHNVGFDEGTSYWEKILARYLAVTGGGKIHTTLPITFTSTSWKLAGWTVYGNNTPNNYSAEGTLPLSFTAHTAGNADDWGISGNNNIGKNLLEIPAETQTINGVKFTIDKQSGTVTANGTANGIAQFHLRIGCPSGNYYFSGCASGGSSSTYYVIAWDNTFSGRAKQWDGVTNSVNDYGTDGNEIKVDSTHSQQLTITLLNGVTVNNIVFKPMIRPADTSATFEPYQVGVGQRTKNYANVETGSTESSVTFTADPDTGTITANGKAISADAQCRVIFNDPSWPNSSMVPLGNYYFSGCPSGGGSSKYNCYSWDYATGACSKKWDGVSSVDQDNGQGNCQVQINGHRQSLTMRIASGYTANNVVFKPMLRAADTGAEFIPYGYEITLNINGTPQTFYIGSTPLTAGQSVSKASTGVDIAAIAGSNTISTDLYNKPSMAIEGVDYVGVGERTVNLFDYATTESVFPSSLSRANQWYKSASGTVLRIPCEPSTTYTIKTYFTDTNFTYRISYTSSDDTPGSAQPATDVIKLSNTCIPAAQTFTTASNTKYILMQIYSGSGSTHSTIEAYNATMLVEGSTTPANFIPYGYEIPLTVSQTGQTDKSYDIYIGDSPLTEGQTVSNTTEIEVFEGENTIDTTLYNKPVMEIEYE